MKALYLICENEFGSYSLNGKYYTVEKMYLSEMNGLKEARKALMYQINNLANHEKSNEYQPTMNFKDRFHFHVNIEGLQGNQSEKRHIVISEFWKSEKRSLLNKYEALEKIKDISRPL